MRKRVLLVNDSDAVLHTLGLVLRKAGYEVDVASRPETGLAKAPEADIMLCDSVLAGDKHASVARQARRRNKRLKVLLWIGAGEQPRDFVKRHFGAFWTLPKPIDPPLLLAHLGRVCALA
jgi:DNA-binding response OmpR family regulator